MRSVHGLLIVEKGAGVENTPLEARVRQTVRYISGFQRAVARCLSSFSFRVHFKSRAASSARHSTHVASHHTPQPPHRNPTRQ